MVSTLWVASNINFNIVVLMIYLDGLFSYIYCTSKLWHWTVSLPCITSLFETIWLKPSHQTSLCSICFRFGEMVLIRMFLRVILSNQCTGGKLHKFVCIAVYHSLEYFRSIWVHPIFLVRFVFRKYSCISWDVYVRNL
jgi:hypothetical protein